MPKIPRMYLNTEYFHVITQGINKSYIFDSPTYIKCQNTPGPIDIDINKID